MHIVNQTHLFPSSCKISNLTFLPSRTIFSLDFLPKFIERAIQDAFDKVRAPDKFGQFAYQPNRSCELVVAIGLNEVEKSCEPSIGFGLDARKAFDTSRWSTMGQVLQKQCNGGRIWYNYCKGRTYRFRGKLGFREKPMGRGAPPGAILAPSAFAGFQMTDTEMTCLGSIKAWFWPGLFSDDKNPVGPLCALRDSRMQRALDSSIQWSKDNFVEYHKTGKKKPICYVFRKSGQVFAQSELDNLSFHGFSIERDYTNWQLGFCQRFFRDDFVGASGSGKDSRDPAKNNAYGYYLDWTAAKEGKSTLSRLAYRFQDVKHAWEPDLIRSTLRSFMLGKIQYGTALYWLRGSTDSVEETRYYYCMSMAACMGLEAPEVTGMICASKARVSAKHRGYLKACKFLDLPTIEDLAIASARNIVRQWSHWDHNLFTYIENTNCVNGVADETAEFALLPELVTLALKHSNHWWPEYEKVKYDIEKRAAFLACRDNRDLIPTFKNYFWKAGIETRRIWAEDGNIPSPTDITNTYKYMCRDHFKCLELADRRVKRIGLVGMIGYTKSTNPKKVTNSEKRSCPVSSTQVTKKRRTVAITCSTKPPAIRGRRENACRVCGYAIKKNCVPAVLDCCNAKVHPICWHNSTSKFRTKYGPQKSLRCFMISTLLQKGGVDPIEVIVPSASQPIVSSSRPGNDRATKSQSLTHDVTLESELAPCPFCGKMLSLDDKRHALTECTRLNELFDPGGNVEEGASLALTPLASWCASMSRVDSLDGTPRSTRVHPRR